MEKIIFLIYEFDQNKYKMKNINNFYNNYKIQAFFLINLCVLLFYLLFLKNFVHELNISLSFLQCIGCHLPFINYY